MLLFTGDLKCFRSLTRDDDDRGLTHNSGDKYKHNLHKVMTLQPMEKKKKKHL